MARSKATITIDRAKVVRAMDLTDGQSMSDVIDIALDRLIRVEQLRRDIARYAIEPQGDDEFALTGMAQVVDLDDEDVDYDALYGVER